MASAHRTLVLKSPPDRGHQRGPALTFLPPLASGHRCRLPSSSPPPVCPGNRVVPSHGGARTPAAWLSQVVLIPPNVGVSHLGGRQVVGVLDGRFDACLEAGEWVGRGEREVPTPGRRGRRATAAARTDTSSLPVPGRHTVSWWLWAKWGGAKNTSRACVRPAISRPLGSPPPTRRAHPRGFVLIPPHFCALR